MSSYNKNAPLPSRLGSASLHTLSRWSFAIAVLLGLQMHQGRLSAQSWYNSAWTYRKLITIDHTKVSGSSNLANFALLISVANDGNLKTVANGGGVGKSDGNDILFN